MGSKNDEVMEGMTDYQLKTMLRFILELVKGSESLDEAQAKIEALLTDE